MPSSEKRNGKGPEVESTGTNRDPQQEAKERELIHKLPDEASPDQERGERHAIGKRTATAGATTDDVSEPSGSDWEVDSSKKAEKKP